MSTGQKTPGGTKPSTSRALPTPCRLDFNGAQALQEDNKDEDSRWWTGHSTWWGHGGWESGWKRSWSGLDWDRDWGCQDAKNWQWNRGLSADMSFEQHPGWGQDAATEQGHVEAALKRAATSTEEQHKPSSPTPVEEGSKQDPTSAVHEAPEQAPTSTVEEASEQAPTSAVHEAPEQAPTSAVEKAPEQAPASAVQEAPEQAPTSAVDEAMQQAHTSAVDEAMQQAPTSAVNEAMQQAPTSTVQEAMQQAPTSTVQEADSKQAPTTKAAGDNPEAAAHPANKAAAAEDADMWRKNKKGEYITPHALYMRFYRSIRGGLLHACVLSKTPRNLTSPRPQ